jgi:hypothetical protein
MITDELRAFHVPGRPQPGRCFKSRATALESCRYGFAMRWLCAMPFGVILGSAAAASDTNAGGGLGQASAWLAVSMVLNSGFVWAGLAVLAGRSATTPVRAAIAGFLGLACAVGSYYAYGALVGDRIEVGFTGLAGVARYWLYAAAFLGPVLGLVGAGTRRPGLLGLAATLVVPLGAITEMLVVRGLGQLSADLVMLGTQIGIVSVAAVVGVTAVARALRPVRQAYR